MYCSLLSVPPVLSYLPLIFLTSRYYEEQESEMMLFHVQITIHTIPPLPSSLRMSSQILSENPSSSSLTLQICPTVTGGKGEITPLYFYRHTLVLSLPVFLPYSDTLPRPSPRECHLVLCEKGDIAPLYTDCLLLNKH